MRSLIAFAASILLMTAPAQARPYEEIMADAREAFTAENFAGAADLLDEAQADHPYSLYLTRNRVLTRILTDRMEDAIAIAKEVADRGLVLETPPNEAFDRMRAEPAFAPVAKRMEENAMPKGVAKIVFENKNAGLLPEAIDQFGGAYFIGSVRTGGIYEIRGGAMREIAKADGGVFDIEVARAAMYAAVNNQLAYEHASERPAEAAVEKFGRASGKIVSKEIVPEGPALLGDLELATLRIYSSDSLTPRLFVQDPDFIPRVLVEDSRFANLQGLALDDKRRRLYVADYLTGLFAIDLETREVTAIANPTNAHLGGIDGLYLYKGDLIGVQNGTSPQRIVRIDLDKKGTTALSLEVLQQALPEWNEPTHGVIAGKEFVYIATSNWPAYDDEGKLREDAKLAPLRLMSVRLTR